MTRYRLDAEIQAAKSLLRLLERARRLAAFHQANGITIPSGLRRLLGEPLPEPPSVTGEP